MKIGASQGKVKAYALVLDKDGNPKVDDPFSIPLEIYNSLSESQKAYIENQKRLSKDSKE